MSIIDDNKILSEVLAEIGAYYQLARDTYRAKTYIEASDIVKNYGEIIVTGKDIADIKGIGKSVVADVDEYLSKGSVKRLTQLREDFKREKSILDYFTSFYGIGPVTASNFINKGYRTLKDLWDHKNELTASQQIGILWRDHLKERIQRSEMDLINDELSHLFIDFKWQMTGSYRREESSSGDIDILIQKDENVDMDKIVDLLNPYFPMTPIINLQTILAKGKKKLAGIFQLSDEYYGHRIDILIISPESWYFALLHFTGSGRFNVLMRNRAKQFGWKLSEYSLLDENGDQILVNNEEEIFDYLRVKYLPPIERTKNLKSLTYL